MQAGWDYFVSFNQAAKDFAQLARPPLTMPVLAIGGEKSLGEVLAAQMKSVARDVTVIVLKNTGHWSRAPDISARRWEHKLAVRAMRVLPKLFDEFHWSRNFTIFPSLRVEPQFRFRGHPHSPQLEIHLAPAQEHHILLAATGP